MKKQLAVVLACAMALSTASTVFAADETDFGSSSEITGSGTVKNPVISYSIPTSAQLSFAVDAFQIADDTGSQIYSEDVEFVNKSEVALQVNVKAYLAPKASPTNGTVNIKSAPSEVTIDDPTVTTKDIYMEIAAKEITGVTGTVTSGAVDGDITVAATDLTYDVDDANHPGAVTPAKAVLGGAPESGSAAPVVMSFALDKATYKAPATPGDPNVLDDLGGKESAAAFRFMGSVNPNVSASEAWADGDVDVKVVFDVTGLTGTVYTALVGDADLDAGLKKANVIAVGGGGGGSATSTPSIAEGASVTYTAGSPLVLNVNPGSGDDAVTGIKSIVATGGLSRTLTAGSHYTWSSSANTITFPSNIVGALGASTAFAITFTTANGDVTVNVTATPAP